MNDQALAAFMANKAEFDALLTELRSMSRDHFAILPGEVQWGHVAMLADWSSRLRQIADQYFHRGEFAP